MFAITDLVSQLRGVPPDHVFLWLDYSVVDQLDPMPGVQAGPSGGGTALPLSMRVFAPVLRPKA